MVGLRPGANRNGFFGRAGRLKRKRLQKREVAMEGERRGGIVLLPRAALSVSQPWRWRHRNERSVAGSFSTR